MSGMFEFRTHIRLFQGNPFVIHCGTWHLTELNCNLMAKDIYESINIPHNEGTLNYKLVGFTLVIGSHFNLIIRLNEVWLNTTC